ncbi:MAG TPA: cell division protein ZapD [Burkholderiaceae bacterium]|nr:cell division protein ZapD [Burkholderiaceae bacterium]HMX11515.1 cell division protein ZapD [Burkholderiaceae bacterium]HMY99874.1 cell division protein ZapD [Burkholderiaceae bacterium]HNB46328.1 cell division protein ZapD [Burkholderiaceae bacterium]HNG81453.1 cell division protein ZapD [Burkholderiaceae bacterium]
MIFYEYPFNESIRTMLRLEHLFSRLTQLVPRDTAVDHHYALATLFEIMDVASRADLKSDLLLELDRQRVQLASFRGNPSISEAALDLAIRRIDSSRERLVAMPGKAGASLSANEWLMSIRSRISIPGGTCEFDLPGYYAWQQDTPEQRRGDLLRWVGTLDPLAEALEVCLALLRETGVPQTVMVRGGVYQQSLGSGRSFQLVRLRIDPTLRIVPEISGNRLLLAVRLMRADADGRLKPTQEDVRLDLTLCA